VLSLVNSWEFDKCVARYNGDFRTRELNCWNQFVQLFFGQLTSLNSLRDICLCLGAHQNKLYYLGIRQRVSQSTLSRANENRDWKIFADFDKTPIRELLTQQFQIKMSMNLKTYLTQFFNVSVVI
jgi:hypothetical protein